MNIARRNRSLIVPTLLLGMWLALASLAGFWADPALSPLAAMLLALVTVTTIINFFRGAGWAVAGLGLILYAAIAALYEELSPDSLVPVAIMAVCLFVTVAFAWMLERQITTTGRQLENDRKLIEDMRIRDPKTGLLRQQYALQNLKTEILRSQRYGLNLCLLFAQIANLDQIKAERGVEQTEDLHSKIAKILTETLREVDAPFQNGKFGAILPTTDVFGADLVAHRLADACAKKLRVSLHVGVAHFPEDAVTDFDLVRAAESALQVALATGQPVVHYSSIRTAVEPEPAAVVAESVLLAEAAGSQGGKPLPGQAAASAQDTPPAPNGTDPASYTPPFSAALGEESLVQFNRCDFADIGMIEGALHKHPKIQSAEMVSYQNRSLMLRICSKDGALQQILVDAMNLPADAITNGNGWLEVNLENIPSRGEHA